MSATPMTAEEAYERERRARHFGPGGVPFPQWEHADDDTRMGWQNKVSPSRIGSPIPDGNQVYLANEAGEVVYAIEKVTFVRADGEHVRWRVAYPPRDWREFGLRSFKTRRGAVQFVDRLIASAESARVRVRALIAESAEK